MAILGVVGFKPIKVIITTIKLAELEADSRIVSELVQMLEDDKSNDDILNYIYDVC